MAKAAKAPAKKTSPVVYVGVLAAVVAVYVFLAPSDSGPARPSSTKAKKKSSKAAGQFTQDDYDAMKNPFPVVTVAAIDAFNPVVKKAVIPPRPPIDPSETGPRGIPVNFTDGEPNWYFTGCPSVDGVRTALFENTTTGESVYVKKGDAFKAARVQSVDVSTVVLVGPNGAAASVPILAYGETPGATRSTPAVASNGPLPVPIGTIGALPPAVGGRPAGAPGTMTLPNGQTIQLPANVAPGAGNDLSVTPDTNYNNGGRRRRNRNRNFGNSNNGF